MVPPLLLCGEQGGDLEEEDRVEDTPPNGGGCEEAERVPDTPEEERRALGDEEDEEDEEDERVPDTPEEEKRALGEEEEDEEEGEEEEEERVPDTPEEERGALGEEKEETSARGGAGRSPGKREREPSVDPRGALEPENAIPDLNGFEGTADGHPPGSNGHAAARRVRARVSWAAGPFEGTPDGHPPGGGRKGRPLVPPKPPSYTPLTRTNIRSLSELLGPINESSIGRLTRRLENS